MYVLRRLKINRFRALAQPVELRFNEGYNLILGLNGSGKTNLLKLLSMVCRFDFTPLSGESFDLEWEGAVGEREFRFQVRRSFSSVVARGRRDEPDQVEWAWSLRMESPGRAPISLAGTGTSGSPPERQVDGWDPCDRWFLLRVVQGDITDRSELYLGAVDESRRLDEALRCFDCLVGEPRSDDSGPMSVGVRVHPVADKTGLVVGYFFPGAVAEVLAEAQDLWEPGVRSFTASSDELPALGQATADLGARSVEWGFKLDSATPVGDDTLRDYSGAEIYVDFGHGNVVHHDLLSFGQKRLIALRHFIGLSDEAPVIADELSNGLHHAWVESILRDIAARQSFLATQNPVVMDAVGFDTLDQARHGLVICEVDEKRKWRWRQLDEAEAAELHAAYQRGIQHVHEILRTRGWW